MTSSSAQDSQKPPTSFVGRRKELAELRAALDESVRGHLYLISGEPGIGKTRLADELAAEARGRGVRVVWGRCWAGGSTPTYWPWIQVLRSCLSTSNPKQSRSVLESELPPAVVHEVAQIVPELRSSSESLKAPALQINPEEARFRLFDSVATLLKSFSRLQPALIVIDDLHDADHASLTMLRFAASELRNSAILIVGTYRDTEVPRSSVLSVLIGELGRDARSIPLFGLSETEVAEFVIRVAGEKPDDALLSRLYATTDGNPLFVDGIVRTLIADRAAALDRAPGFKIPDNVREAIRERLYELSAETNIVLTIAAAIGSEFDSGRCSRVGDVSLTMVNRSLDEARDAAIVMPLSQGHYRFSHALIRDAVYDEIETNIRVGLHTRIGKDIEDIHSRNLPPHLAELAHHFCEARISDKGAEYSIQAAKAAEAISAYEDAVQFFEMGIVALKSLGPIEPTRELELLLALATNHFYAGSFPSAVGTFHKAAEIARGLKDWRSFAVAVLGAAGHPQDVMVRAIDPKLLALVKEALANHRSPDGLRSMILARLAVESTLSSSEADRTQSLFSEATELARSAGDSNALFNALNSSAYFRILGPEQGELVELATLAKYVSNPDARWLASLWNFRRCLAAADVVGADSYLDELGCEAEHSRLPGARSCYAALRATRAIMEGRLEVGERWSDEAMRILKPWGRFDPSQMMPLTLPLRREQGRLGEVVPLARRFVELSPSFRFARVNLALVLEAVSQKDEARREFERLALNNFRDVPRDTNWLATLTLLGDLCARVGDADHARVLYEMLSPYAGMIAHFLILTCYGPVSHYLGILATLMMRFERAEEHFRSALDLSSRMNATLLTAYTQRDYAHMLVNRHSPGDRDKARGLVSEAGQVASALYLKNLHAELKELQSEWEEQNEGNESIEEKQVHSTALPVHEIQSLGGVFRKQGEFWTLAYRGKTFRLKDVKGLAYIAYLLAHPGEQIHVHELIARVDEVTHAGTEMHAEGSRDIPVTSGLGDAGGALDQHALAAYRRRLRELAEDLAEAERHNDIGRAERIRGEQEFLSAELSAAVGIGGRSRKATSHAERARGIVSKNIRAGLEKIRSEDAALGRYFAASIKTGYYCAYLPDPDRKISWQL
jgi:tetratricopeptide (TPR) repeat protein